MNRESFIGLLDSEAALKNASLKELEDLVESFPYCQTSRTLLTRKLKLEEHHDYDAVLKTTAIYAGNRRILRDHLEMKHFDGLEADVTATADGTAGEPEVVVPEVLKKDEPHVPAMQESVEPEVPGESAAIKAVPSEMKADEAEKAGTEKTGAEPKKEGLAQVRDIVEGRLRTIESERQHKPEDKPAKKPGTKKSDRSQAQLIDEFIRKQPSISRPQATFFDPEEAARESVVDEENIVSETLARIYLDQKHFEKAINIYRKLSLIYPEKSSYFAAQIEKAVKELKK